MPLQWTNMWWTDGKYRGVKWYKYGGTGDKTAVTSIRKVYWLIEKQAIDPGLGKTYVFVFVLNFYFHYLFSLEGGQNTRVEVRYEMTMKWVGVVCMIGNSQMINRNYVLKNILRLIAGNVFVNVLKETSNQKKLFRPDDFF